MTILCMFITTNYCINEYQHVSNLLQTCRDSIYPDVKLSEHLLTSKAQWKQAPALYCLSFCMYLYVYYLYLSKESVESVVWVRMLPQQTVTQALWVFKQTRCFSLNVLHYRSIVKTGTQIRKCKAVDARALRMTETWRAVLFWGNRASADNICSYRMSHAPPELYCLESWGPSVSVAL